MKLKCIYTDRYFERSFSWHLVFEWEDIYSNELNLELVDSRKASKTAKYVGKACNFASRKLHVPDSVLFKIFSLIDNVTFRKNGLYILLLDLKRKFYFVASKNTIPLIIDFWKHTNLSKFYKTYGNCKALLIPDIEALNYLKANNCPIRLFHFPLSLPDKYKLASDATFSKVYDIIMPGRINIVLWHYLQDYLIEHPEIEFLHLVQIDGKHFYNSNKSGIVGESENRQTYLNLLRSSKVAFYSTPGMDGGIERTGGFNPVTPRFLEIVSAGCRVIARYTQNDDTDYFELNKICKSVDNYLAFENQLTQALSDEKSQIKQYADYLDKHYTSKRAQLLKTILDQID